MTSIGWIQIVVYGLVILALTKPLGLSGWTLKSSKAGSNTLSRFWPSACSACW